MPLHKKNSSRNKIIILTLVAVLVVLMIISFPPAQHINEIVLFP